MPIVSLASGILIWAMVLRFGDWKDKDERKGFAIAGVVTSILFTFFIVSYSYMGAL